MIKFTPTEWQRILGFEIRDPDGWDRREMYFDADWSKPLSFNEFWDKMQVSTCSRHPEKRVCESMAARYVRDNVAD